MARMTRTPLLPGAVLAARTFTMADQEQFAQASGDRNPMHMDALEARRTQAGKPVVHGIHGLLWALDALAFAGVPLAEARHLKVSFRRFIYLEREVCVRLNKINDSLVLAELIEGGMVATSIVIRYGERVASPDGRPCLPVEVSERPADLDIVEMSGRSGRLSPHGSAKDDVERFPHVAAALGARRLSGFAQTSRIVGMVCPGRHSIFSMLAIDLVESAGSDEGMTFHVESVDEDHRRVDLQVSGGGLSGQLVAYVRDKPAGALPLSAVARHVRPDEFGASVSLIAGGSRGLGAVTAKIVAAGGGRVIITYARGRIEAEALKAEIDGVYGQGRADIRRFDAMLPVAPQLTDLGEMITHLYYFATPQIFTQKKEVFDHKVYDAFTRFYVVAFHDLCMAIQQRQLSILYPSSIAVVDRPRGLTEYSMAKCAGEMLCRDLAVEISDLRIRIERLPRIRTDQTASIMTVASADPFETMLPLVRALHHGS